MLLAQELSSIQVPHHLPLFSFISIFRCFLLFPSFLGVWDCSISFWDQRMYHSGVSSYSHCNLLLFLPLFSTVSLVFTTKPLLCFKSSRCRTMVNLRSLVLDLTLESFTFDESFYLLTTFFISSLVVS